VAPQVLHHRGELVGLVPEAREREALGGHLGVDLERPPGDVELDAAGELRAGFLEADRPDEAPRSGVVAEDLDAHDRNPRIHDILLCRRLLRAERRSS